MMSFGAILWNLLCGNSVVYKILILLSNTDAIHIETFEQNGASFIVIFTTAEKVISPLK
jgi:hypothetical protein